VVCALASVSGWYLIRCIESGRSKLSRYIGREITHGAIYEAAFEGGNEEWCSASVLTNISHDGKYVLYNGIVREIVLGAGGKLSSVVLASATRRLMEIGEKGFDTASENTVDVYEAPGEIGTLFVPESNILNVLIIKNETIFREE
jgi:hypothetical protein